MESRSHWEAARTLWKRAPWWRFTVMSSVLLVLVMVLFPPHRSTGSLDSASYRAPSVATSAPAAASPTTAAAPATASAPPTSQPVQVPRTASLGLARPDQKSPGTTGIDSALLGRTYSGKIQMSGFELQLPPGEWAMLASSTAKYTKHTDNAGMTYFLGRIEQARLTGAIEVTALRSPDRSGFDEPPACTAQPTIYSHKESSGQQGCWNIEATFTEGMQRWADKAAKMQVIYRMAGGDLAAKGVSYPQDMIGVHFARYESWGYLHAVYLFSPETEHIRSNTVPTLQDSDWFGDNLQRYPEKVAYTEKLRHWGEANWPLFNTAFTAGAPPDAGVPRIEPAKTRLAEPVSTDTTSELTPNILRVRYMSPRGRELDATEQFKTYCGNGVTGCRARCDNALAGSDPDFNIQKFCLIEYQCPARPAQELRVQEGSYATLNCTSIAASKAADARKCAIEKFGQWRRSQSVSPSPEAMNNAVKQVNAECGASLEFSVDPAAAQSQTR